MPPRAQEDDLIAITELARSLGSEMVPLGAGFSYIALSPLNDEDLKEFLHDPLAAVPPRVCEIVAPLRIVLAPYIIRLRDSSAAIAFHAPDAQRRLHSAFVVDTETTLCLSVSDEDASEYHQLFFNTVAHLLSFRLALENLERYSALVTAELKENVHGEVNEQSWKLKQGLPVQKNGHGPTLRSRNFREYALQSFVDTMTLYMHGICCDIDVETGPRQLPSRWLRKRLEALYGMFPPPNNRPVLPEHLSRR